MSLKWLIYFAERDMISGTVCDIRQKNGSNLIKATWRHIWVQERIKYLYATHTPFKEKYESDHGGSGPCWSGKEI